MLLSSLTGQLPSPGCGPNLCFSSGISVESCRFRAEWGELFGLFANVNGAGAICDQRTPKVLVSCREEATVGHMAVNRVY
jgi:hypothetical protein